MAGAGAPRPGRARTLHLWASSRRPGPAPFRAAPNRVHAKRVDRRASPDTPHGHSRRGGTPDLHSQSRQRKQKLKEILPRHHPGSPTRVQRSRCGHSAPGLSRNPGRCRPSRHQTSRGPHPLPRSDPGATGPPAETDPPGHWPLPPLGSGPPLPARGPRAEGRGTSPKAAAQVHQRPETPFSSLKGKGPPQTTLLEASPKNGHYKDFETLHRFPTIFTGK